MFPFHKLLSSTLAGACRPIAAAFAVWPLFLILSQIVSAQKYSVLYTFQGESTGSTPVSGLVEDSAGNLYGTTEIGGNTSVFASGLGTVYKLTASGTETVLYNFSGGADGAYPFASVVRDSSGNLFGTTMGGGAGQCGTVFKLNPAGKETVLHSFDCMSQGAKPVSSLIMDPDGNLYGTTEVSGQSNPSGVVFKLDTSGNETVLHTFTGKADGGTPVANLIRDSAGNLYGTTENGGSNGFGVVFKLDANANETVLHNFAQGTDGAWPLAPLIEDAAGNLYGTTVYGDANTYGVVFKINTSGQMISYDVFSQTSRGASPEAPVVRDAEGNLYGTTSKGGTYNLGVVFKVDVFGNETVLYNFTGKSDGSRPLAGLLFDSAGNLYGTTSQGGNLACKQGGGWGCGVVFKLTP